MTEKEKKKEKSKLLQQLSSAIAIVPWPFIMAPYARASGIPPSDDYLQ